MVNLIGCRISENTATSGGGIYISGSNPKIIRCLIDDNRAFGSACGGSGRGGGIVSGELESGYLYISDSILSGNQTDGKGGGIHGSEFITMVNNLVIGNSSEWDGGGCYLEESEVSIFNTTIYGNTADGQGGGISLDGEYAEIINSIIWENSSPQIDYSVEELSITFSDIMDYIPGAGNISEDPVFIGDWYLSQVASGQSIDSPCLDAGMDLVELTCYWSEFGEICMDDMTSRTDLVPDSGISDMGYHHSALESTPTETSTPVPTVTITPTPVPSSTETPVTTNTPGSTPTDIPATSTPLPTTTPGTECSEWLAELWMPSDWYTPGDFCELNVSVCNPGPDQHIGMSMFVVLDVFGTYFFAPEFDDFGYYVVDLPVGIKEFQIIPSFEWPEESGFSTGITWISALSNREMTLMYGSTDMFSFGWDGGNP